MATQPHSVPSLVGQTVIHKDGRTGKIQKHRGYDWNDSLSAMDAIFSVKINGVIPTTSQRWFRSEFALPPSRRAQNDLNRKEAMSKALANGWAMHRERSLCREIDPTESPREFSDLVDLALRSGATITLTAPEEVAGVLSEEMNNYVIPVSEKSHALKSNIAIVNSKELGRLQGVMGFNVHTNGYTNGFAEVEICSKELARELGRRGVISERFLRTPGEDSDDEKRSL